MSSSNEELLPKYIGIRPPEDTAGVRVTIRLSMAFHLYTSGSNIAITTKLSSKLLKELQSKSERCICAS